MKKYLLVGIKADAEEVKKAEREGYIRKNFSELEEEKGCEICYVGDLPHASFKVGGFSVSFLDGEGARKAKSIIIKIAE